MTEKEEISLKYRKKWLGELREMLFKNIDTSKYAIFLFGSAVNNLVKAHDIDIGILGNEKLPIRTESDIYYIIEESIIPMKVDIVDFAVVSDDFRKTAFSEIEIWNKPQNIILN